MDNLHHKILLSFDFGMRRIGVAVGQTVSRSASPLPIIKAQDGIPNWQEILNLITTWKVDGLVIGIPYNMDGTEQHMTFAARKFARRLQIKFNLPIYFVDERLTTVESKMYRKNHDPDISLDSYAAKLILESWLRNYKGDNS